MVVPVQVTLSPARTTSGLVLGVLASMTFATSGAFLKPLLEGDWSPAAAVTARTAVAGLVLLPIAILAVRGRWAAVWRGRWRIVGMALVGVAGTQLVYFASLQRIPVSTALLIEYLAPLLLVGWVWATTRKAPRLVVVAGAALAIAGLVLTIGPGSLGGAMDTLGVVFAGLAAVGCAGYYIIAARPSDGLPSVALAGFGLALGSLSLGVLGALRVVPFEFSAADVAMFGGTAPWWAPLLFVGVLGTGFAYVASIAASERLGARLMSFVGLLEVVFAAVLAWLVLGEAITPLQVVGGVAILGGIALVRAEKPEVPLDALPTDTAAIAALATATVEPLPVDRELVDRELIDPDFGDRGPVDRELVDRD